MIDRKITALRLVWEAQKGMLRASFPKLTENDLEMLKPKRGRQAHLTDEL